MLSVFLVILCYVRASGTECRWRPAERWRGVNLPYCLYDKGFRKDATYREEDFMLVKALGFNFVRLPLDYRCWIAEDDWNKIDDAALSPLDEVVTWARKYGLHVQFCFHRAPGFSVNRAPAESRDLFSDPEAQHACELHWRHFARRYASVPNEYLSFNLLNETPSHKDLARILNRLIAAVHDEDPRRFIVCDGAATARVPVQGLALESGFVGQSLRGYSPMTVSHCGVSYLDEALEHARPHWPAYGFTSPLYGNRKPEWSVPLRIADAPSGLWKVSFGRVNGDCQLEASVGGKRLAICVLSPATNDSRYAKAIYSPRWNVTSGRPVSPWEFSMDAAGELRITMTEGDWCEIDEISVTDPAGRTAELPSSYCWGIRANVHPIAFRGFGEAIPFAEQDAPLTGEDWLMKNVIKPWLPVIEQGGFVMVGECGATRHVPYSLYLSWMEDQLRLWKKLDIGYAFWTLRGAFGPLDTKRKGTREVDFHGHKLDAGLFELVEKYK